MDLGTLVVIAGRALEQDVPAVLDLLDVAAAEAALADAESPADAVTRRRSVRLPCSARSSGIARWPAATIRPPCWRPSRSSR